MNQTTIPFLQHIRNEASQKAYTVLDLPEQQGVVILPQTYPPQEQIALLKQLITKIEASIPASPQSVEDMGISADHDCQVTVEERAQLFKFLSST